MYRKSSFMLKDFSTQGRGQVAYPVLYRSGSQTVMGYFNPFLCEMLYDTLRNSTDQDRP